VLGRGLSDGQRPAGETVGLRRGEPPAHGVSQRNQAVAAQHTVIARGMMAQPDRIRDQDPRLALQLGVAVLHIDPSPLTEASLVQTLVSSHYQGTLTGHTDGVFSVAFSPDGHTLAAASNNVILWDLTPLEELRRATVREACIRAGGPLDTATWDRYAPGISYQNTCADC
jgi:WD domain, G-beta repeat